MADDIWRLELVRNGSSSDPPMRLKALVQERVRLMSADCDTFLHVRCNGSLLPEWGSGGGNFVMALGLLSALNPLAKLHKHLDSPESFVTSEDKRRVAEAKRDLKGARGTLKGQRERLTPAFSDAAGAADILENVTKAAYSGRIGWKSPFLGGVVNETQAFQDSVERLRRSGIDLGLAEQREAEDVWKSFRNGLAHMAWPTRTSVAAYGSIAGMSFDEARIKVKSGNSTFFKDGGAWACNADRLNLDLLDIADWLGREIDAKYATSPSHVEATLRWAEGPIAVG